MVIGNKVNATHIMKLWTQFPEDNKCHSPMTQQTLGVDTVTPNLIR